MEIENSRVIGMKKMLFALFCTLIFLDQLSKRFFVQSSWAGFLYLFPVVWNSGSAWGMKVDPRITIVLGVLVLMYIFVLSRKSKVESRKYSLSMLLLSAGIVGNMIDRILYGAVRDFLWIGDRFPVFNLADVYMCGGVALLIWWEWGKV